MKELAGHTPERGDQKKAEKSEISVQSVNTVEKELTKSPDNIEVGFEGDHLRFVQQLIGKKEPTTSDTLMHALWPEEAKKDPQKAYLKIKRIANETKEKLTDTPLEISSKGGWHGGYSLGEKDVTKSEPYVSKKPQGLDGRTKRHENDAEFALPETGETFYGKHAEFLKHLFHSDTEYTRTDSIGAKIWENKADDTPLIVRRSHDLVHQIKQGLTDTDWKIVGKPGKHGGIKILREKH